MIQLAGQFVPVKVKGDADPGRSIAEDYDIMGYPTIIIMDGSGKVIEKMIGFRDAKDFASVLERLAGVKPIDRQAMQELADRVKNNEADYESAAKLALLLAQVDDLYEAVDMLDLAEEHAPESWRPHLAAAYTEIGDRLAAKEKYAKARTYYRKAMERASAAEDKCTAGVGLAGAYIGLKRYAYARDELQDVLANADLPPSLKTRAESLFATVTERN